ncbi:MAG TPA: IS1595 family transposase [Candidatus Saccharimonadales bacterium]|nr:IS1595 family transposase [Candidatus Saccharimonadales bacterium]
MHNKFTTKQFHARFPTDDACLEAVKQLRFGDYLDCPKCVRQNHFYRVKGRSAYACSFCGHHIYPLKGSIFDHSSTPLTTWFYAIYLMAQTRSGMSAKQLERMTGVTYKTAWRMFNQIRKLMAEDGMPLFGEVEVDEMYMHADPRKRSSVNARLSREQVVFGMVERGGRAKVVHVQSSGERVLVPEIRKHLVLGTTVYSDEWRAYGKLAIWGFYHSTIKHKDAVYVDGRTHTQNIENLWSNAKRGIRGVYRHVSPKYLQNYADEYAFRYSYRKTPKFMFDLILANVSRS